MNVNNIFIDHLQGVHSVKDNFPTNNFYTMQS